jgi:hypothetical protein
MKRRRTYRKGRSRRKKSYRRKYKKKSSRKGYLQTYRFSRRYIGNEIIPNSVGFANGAVAPALGQVVNPTDFQNLFDQYCLVLHVCTFTLVTDPSTQQPVPATGERLVPTLYWSHDNNDSNPPPTVNSLRERQGCQVRYLRMGVPIRIVSKPALLIPAVITVNASGTIVGSNLIPKTRQWCDTSDMATPHFTFKWAIDNAAPSSRIRVEQKLYFKCRGVR